MPAAHHPRRRRGDFSERDKANLRLLTQHLKAAIGVQARLSHLESSHRLLAGTVDKLSVGSILLDTGAK